MSGPAFSVTSPFELLEAVGVVLEPTAWRTVDQDAIDTFGQLTDDTQWVHCDIERASRGPFGTTVAHGYLTLAFCSAFLGESLSVGRLEMAVNYGLDKVRFPGPLRAGSSIRGVVRISAAELADGGKSIDAGIRITIEVRGERKPACVADLLVRYICEGGRSA